MPSLTSNTQNTSKVPAIAFSLVLVILLAIAIWLSLDRQNVVDWLKLIGYHEPSQISALAEEDTMTPLAQTIFKVNHPVIEDKSQFATHCPNNGGEQTIVLGCYHPVQDGIFLLGNNDPTLNGVEQVTAAHEMLHGAYDRLSSSERTKVNAMLIDFYHGLHDPRIQSEIGIYKRTEPTAVVNEMNSVFGTEVMNLPPALEQYYKQYFTNRQQIVNYANQYESAFTSRQAIIAADNSTLSQLKPQIDELQSDINSKLNNIDSLQGQLASVKSTGNIAAYNAMVPAYNAAVDSYNTEVAQLKSLIASYNSTVNQLNSVALVENQLYQILSGNQNTINP